jgi:hypothetical protein
MSIATLKKAELSQLKAYQTCEKSHCKKEYAGAKEKRESLEKDIEKIVKSMSPHDKDAMTKIEKITSMAAKFIASKENKALVDCSLAKCEKQVHSLLKKSVLGIETLDKSVSLVDVKAILKKDKMTADDYMSIIKFIAKSAAQKAKK